MRFLLLLLTLSFCLPTVHADELLPEDPTLNVIPNHPTGSFHVFHFTGLVGEESGALSDSGLVVEIRQDAVCSVQRPDQPRSGRVPCKLDGNDLLLSLTGHQFVRFHRTRDGWSTGRVDFSRRVWTQVDLHQL